MKLWTIQHKAAYEEMLRTGVLRANPKYILHEFFRESYEWMAAQMLSLDVPDEHVLLSDFDCDSGDVLGLSIKDDTICLIILT